MQRRQFIAVLGAATTLPLVARAQQNERVRRIAVLMGLPKDDPETQASPVLRTRSVQVSS